MLFRSDTEKELWIGHWCERCHAPKPDGVCPILEKALSRERKPVEWTRNQRHQLAKDAYKCGSFADRPALIAKAPKQFEDVPMFDMPTHDVHLVPVEGWPDPPDRRKETDHQ